MADLSHSSEIESHIEAHGVPSSLGGRMIDRESLDYFRSREIAERTAAENAASDAARRVHQELAHEYAELT
jgi:hypothetical protein